MANLGDPIFILATEAGTIPAGAIRISVKNIGQETAYINGEPLEPGEPTNFDLILKPYRAISYDPKGSTLKIRYTV